MAQEFNFNGADKVIYLMNTESFSVQESYSKWKEWVLTGSNSMFPQAFRYVGGEPTTPGNYLGVTYFILNGWKFQPTGSDHIIDVTGNIYTDDPNSPNVFITASGDYNVTIKYIVSNINQVQVVDAISGAALTDLQNKIDALYKLHGLHPSHPLTVTTSSRSVDNIEQLIESTDNSTVVTRI